MTSSKTQSRANGNYLGAVGEYLAINGATPERVGQHLEELAAHLDASGAEPVDEFGPPKVLARNLIEADRQGSPNRWLRLVGTSLGIAAWTVVMVLLAGGNEPATLSGRDIGNLAVPVTIGLFALSPIAAGFRDQLFGVTDAPHGAMRTRFAWLVAMVIGAVSLSVAVEIILDDRVIGLESTRSWVAGLTLLAVLSPLTAWAYRRSLGRAKFPEGSPLRSSNMTRHIRFSGPGNSPWSTMSTGIGGLAPMLAMLALIVAARWLPEPLDIAALLAAVAVGPAWLYRLSKARPTTTSPE